MGVWGRRSEGDWWILGIGFAEGAALHGASFWRRAAAVPFLDILLFCGMSVIVLNMEGEVMSECFVYQGQDGNAEEEEKLELWKEGFGFPDFWEEEDDVCRGRVGFAHTYVMTRHVWLYNLDRIKCEVVFKIK